MTRDDLIKRLEQPQGDFNPLDEPLICSQGGFVINGKHIKYWKERAIEAEREVAALRARATLKPYSDIDRLKEKGMRFVEE